MIVFSSNQRTSDHLSSEKHVFEKIVRGEKVITKKSPKDHAHLLFHKIFVFLATQTSFVEIHGSVFVSQAFLDPVPHNGYSILIMSSLCSFL